MAIGTSLHVLVYLRGSHYCLDMILAEHFPRFLGHLGHHSKILRTQQLNVELGGLQLKSGVDVLETVLVHEYKEDANKRDGDSKVVFPSKSFSGLRALHLSKDCQIRPLLHSLKIIFIVKFSQLQLGGAFVLVQTLFHHLSWEGIFVKVGLIDLIGDAAGDETAWITSCEGVVRATWKLRWHQNACV